VAKLNGGVQTSIGYIAIQAETFLDFDTTVEKIKKKYGLIKAQGPVLTYNSSIGGTTQIG
jgi:hypothetical protein